MRVGVEPGETHALLRGAQRPGTQRRQLGSGEARQNPQATRLVDPPSLGAQPGNRVSDHTRERSALVRATTDHPIVVTRAHVACRGALVMLRAVEMPDRSASFWAGW